MIMAIFTLRNVLFASIVSAVGYVMLSPSKSINKRLAKGDPKNIVVVVLGISDKEQAIERANVAIDFALNNNVDTIICSGMGSGIDGLAEATWMARYIIDLLKDSGVDINVFSETQSNSTASNVINVVRMIKDSGLEDRMIVFVSNHQHVVSATYCARYADGLNAYYVQYPEVNVPTIPDENILICSRAGCCGRL